VYYNKWVRPRISQIPGRRGVHSEIFANQNLRWLDHDTLLKRGRYIDWKRQYKIRHNWIRGVCDVSEIHLADQSTASVLPLVRLHDSIAFAVDAFAGIRAWDLRQEQRLLARMSLEPSSEGARIPTSLCVDSIQESDDVRLAVGFHDGTFCVYQYCLAKTKFELLYAQKKPHRGSILAIAMSAPLLVVLTDLQLLSLYRFDSGDDGKLNFDQQKPPEQLGVFKSQNAWPPLSLAIRKSAQNLLVSVAYSLPTYLSGWTVGLQEMWLSSDGDIKSSRLATAVSSSFKPLKSRHHIIPDGASPDRQAPIFDNVSLSRPTSVSYTHPYLLCSHPDNTLTLYLVTSTAQSLAISRGSSLWGHTSSVAGAHVGSRGRAVSISRFGDELRLWELEGGLSSAGSRRRLAAGDLSITIRPERKSLADEADSSTASKVAGSSTDRVSQGDVATTNENQPAGAWIDFDEENVLVLKESDSGAQALTVYNFS
jgi:hypothetical protein